MFEVFNILQLERVTKGSFNPKDPKSLFSITTLVGFNINAHLDAAGSFSYRQGTYVLFQSDLDVKRQTEHLV